MLEVRNAVQKTLRLSKHTRLLALALCSTLAVACAKDHASSASPAALPTTPPAAPAAPVDHANTPAQPETPLSPQPTPAPTIGTTKPKPPTKPHTKPKESSGDAAALDRTATGGQPGFVYLFGAFADSSHQQQNFNFTVNLEPGTGWRGTRPPLANGLLVKKADTPNGSSALIAKVAGAKNFANFGCNLDEHPEVRGLAQIGIPILSPSPSSSSSSDQPVEHISAQVIIICGQDSFKTAKATVLVAATVFLSHVDLHVSSDTTRLFSIITGNLVVDSASTIALRGADGADTSIPGPTLAIAADNLTGPGRLTIDSDGSSYVAARKKTH